MKTALITGITGQDGSYLAEFLLSKGYQVHGIIRRASTFNTQRIDHIYIDPHEEKAKMFLHYGDLTDPGIITDIIWNVKPDEVYNLGAQSHVKVSFEMPEFTGNVTGIGTTRILEAIRRSGGKSRFYQASSSEMYGDALPPQGESTPFRPRSPYAAAKVYAYWITVNYREGYNIFASNGILFNHESPRRGETFVTRKITRAVAQMMAGQQKKLYMGNLNAKRDWGFAPEYVEAMWLMLQQDKPDDYILGMGESHSVREFIEQSFSYAGLELEWSGQGLEETGVVKSASACWDSIFKPGDTIIEVDPQYFRPVEVESLQADIGKTTKLLGWTPRITFSDLVKIMVDYDLKLFRLPSPGEGAKIAISKGFQYIKHDFETKL